MDNQFPNPAGRPNNFQPAPQQPGGAAPQGNPSPGQAVNDFVNSMNSGLLPVVGSITEAVTIGVKNAASLILASVLYVLTIWIPYLNVGTTIAMLSIPIELSKGHVISPLFIFNSVYRKYMGQFFIFGALMTIGILAAAFFFIVPAIVLSYSWCIAIYLLFDKKLNAVQALSKSNEYTYGYKLKIFCIKFLFSIVFMVLYWLFSCISSPADSTFGLILFLVVFVVQLAANMGLDAVIYRELLKRTDVTI